jgi:hypothetical protein
MSIEPFPLQAGEAARWGSADHERAAIETLTALADAFRLGAPPR